MVRRLGVVSVVLAVLLGLAGLAAVPVGASGAPRPTSIALPDGFFPEGIAIDGHDAYVGSLVDGTIQRLDLRSGAGEVFAAPPGPARVAVGLDVDQRGRLWVAGGGPALDPALTPGFRVYDTETGQLLVEQPVAAGFVNDVIVTRTAAWLTDSFGANLIRVPLGRDGSIGAPELVPLGGDWVQGPGFNANGIVAARGGRQLIVAQSTAPEGGGAALYRMAADATGLDAERIDVDGAVPGADGLVLVGRTLYSVAGGNGVVKVRLSGGLNEGRVVDTLAVPGSVTPTTAAVRGNRLYVVDAKFPFFGDPTTPFAVTRHPPLAPVPPVHRQVTLLIHVDRLARLNLGGGEDPGG